MATTKTRTLGGGLVRKLGFNWTRIWRSSGAAVWPNMPAGEDAASMAAHAAAAGIKLVRTWLVGGDYVSGMPYFEVRPGEFFYGGELVTRDGNGDITNTTYSKIQSPPDGTNNIKEILDACWANNIKVSVDLTKHVMFQSPTQWDWHPYKTGCLNASSNARAVGVAGWLNSIADFWTDATAISYFKGRIDAFLFNFGEHEAIESYSLGNELLLLTMTSESDFFDWVAEMSAYLWAQYGSVKPGVNISTYRDSAQSINAAFGNIASERRVVSWHNYFHGHKELQEIMDWIDTIRTAYDTFSFEPDYTGQLRPYQIRVEENWGFGEGPTAVPDTIIDINIQGDPVTHTLAYEVPPDDTVSPYPHERMYSFLAMALDPTMIYMRWPNYIDGIVFINPSLKRCAEIMEVASDFQATAVFNADDMERWEDQISSSGALDFKAALKLEEICLTFVLVGSGNQTIDFGVTGTWKLVTYDWEGDGADSWQRVVNEADVDAAATAIAFGDYTDGFCPGYLIIDTAYRNPVQTTITTEVVVDVVMV